MKGYVAFTKKELLESVRSYRLFILVLLFLALGFLNPISAKYLPEIVKTLMQEGITIDIAKPVILDCWVQFFKNTAQIGLIVIVITCAGLMPSEFVKGTLLHVLTKGLKRWQVIVAKLTASVVIWSIVYVLSFGVTIFYSWLLFERTAVPELIPAVGFVWLFGVLMIVWCVLGGTLSGSYAGSIILAGTVFVISMILSMFHTISKYSPVKLVTDNMQLLTGSAELETFIPAVVVTLVLIAAGILFSILVFRRKQL